MAGSNGNGTANGSGRWHAPTPSEWEDLDSTVGQGDRHRLLDTTMPLSSKEFFDLFLADGAPHPFYKLKQACGDAIEGSVKPGKWKATKKAKDSGDLESEVKRTVFFNLPGTSAI